MKAAIPSKGANRLGIGMAWIVQQERSSRGLDYRVLACNAVDEMLSLRGNAPSINPLAPTPGPALHSQLTSEPVAREAVIPLRCLERYSLCYEWEQKAVIRVIQPIKQSNEARNLLLIMVQAAGLGDGGIDAKRRKSR